MLKPLSSKVWAAKYFPVIKIAGDPTVKAPVALNKSVCVIGRRLGVHLPLNSTKVSKVHALIVRQRNNVYIRDLASRNHVYVNGLAVRETDLDTGDSVKVGPYTLHCESGFTQSAQVAARPTPPPVPAPDATLQIVGEDAPRPLEGRALLIGQREDCDLVLDDQRVSPVHAVIFELDGKHVLRDLNSGAGVYVNNERVHQHELESGDEIRIARTRLRYDVAGAAAAAVAPPPPVEPEIAVADNEDDATIRLDEDEASATAEIAPADAATDDPHDEDERLELITDDEAAAIAHGNESPPTETPFDEEHAWDDHAPEPPASLGVMDDAVHDADRHTEDPDEDLITLEADDDKGHDDDDDLIARSPPSENAATVENDHADNDDAPASIESTGSEPIPLARPRLEIIDAPEPAAPPAEPLPPPPGAQREADDWDKESPEDSSPPTSAPPTQKLDRIVSELSEKVTELETTWKEVKDDVQQARANQRFDQ